MNALASETSPYLLQHKDNPVDWLPWGEEAFRRARELDRPVFLSVGYSTCHWCHVMARECFENPEIAALMNEHFVNVKVDREERPDVDRLYMAYVQATTGSGGWPMSVWLTPDGEPFFGGTYFPPEDRWGRAGFPRILRTLAAAWKNDRAKIREIAANAIRALEEPAETLRSGHLSHAVHAGLRQFELSFDSEYGGFGGAPKFPRPVVFELLLREEGRPREMALATLRAMCAGGIHDALGGGFHRYSVDRFWHVPHFEKMLYDQAQMASALVEAWQLTHEPLFEITLRDTLDYVLRDLSLPGGGFASAEDADSEPPERPGAHAEGAFYLWREEEIRSLLPREEAALIIRLYSVRPDGNAPEGADPHGELAGKNILHARADDLAKVEGSKYAPLLREARRKLLEARAKRPRPHRDEKVIAAWNGLVISALSRAGAALREPRYIGSAERAALFLRQHLVEGGQLRRSWQGRLSPVPAFAEDYAFLGRGLLDLYEATAEPGWLRWAGELQQILDREFWDEKSGGYFTSRAGDPTLRVRTKGDHDGAEPLAESVAAENAVRMERMGLPISRRAQAIFAARAAEALRIPTAFPALLAVFVLSEKLPRQAVIASKPGDPARAEFLHALRRRHTPELVILHADGAENSAFLSQHRSDVLEFKIPEPGAALYLCENFTCQAPVFSPEELARLRN